jgi:hypothetical protein
LNACVPKIKIRGQDIKVSPFSARQNLKNKKPRNCPRSLSFQSNLIHLYADFDKVSISGFQRKTGFLAAVASSKQIDI